MQFFYLHDNFPDSCFSVTLYIMKYNKIRKGIFLSRENRFVGTVEIDGIQEKVHIKNTGRCKELLVSGNTVFLEDFHDRMGSRKMAYSLVSVVRDTGTDKACMINMDSQAPNRVAEEGILSGRITIPGFDSIALLKREKVFGSSRIDLYAEDTGGRRALIEVKGVTLEKDGIVMFPDAPTQRGVKHVMELADAADRGYIAGIIFIVQMRNAELFTPNRDTHPEFADALRNAAERGVFISAYTCDVGPDSLEVADEIPAEI